jgi:uncharacterized protein YkwD
LLVVLVLAVPAALAPVAAARGTCAGANLRPTTSDQHALAVATLCLVNGIRAADELGPLHSNHELARVASGEAHQLVTLDYFADVSPTGVTPLAMITAARYPRPARPFSYGQNLAWGTEAGATPASIVEAWMASPPHRAIILEPAFRDVGVAALASVPAAKAQGHPGATYAMEFGRR